VTLLFSKFLPKLWLHLQITGSPIFVIFYDITSFGRLDFLYIISITIWDIWFFGK